MQKSVWIALPLLLCFVCAFDAWWASLRQQKLSEWARSMPKKENGKNGPWSGPVWQENGPSWKYTSLLGCVKFPQVIKILQLRRLSRVKFTYIVEEVKVKFVWQAFFNESPYLITLCNKDFGEWDISPDSTLLGVTDTWMKSVFAQLALVFPQFWVFEAIFDACGQNCHKLFYSVCTFYCTQNNRLDLTVSTQKSV